MQEKFKNNITENFAFLKDKKLLLAVSGGIDSMVMVDIFRKLSFDIAMAHCNFQLRGFESKKDEEFVENYAKTNKITVFSTQFNTLFFANSHKLSIQVAARELRYNWFYEILENQNYDYVVTAHHLNDSVETFFINLVRGTGLNGLTGIPTQNEKIVRPLLDFSRLELEKYAQENAIEWREDSSNASDKYLRNKIRHNLIPLLKKLNPDFISSFQKTQNYLQESKIMVDNAANAVYQEVAKEIENEIHFDINELTKRANFKSYLYHWLTVYGFSAWEDIYQLIDNQSGKQVFSKEYRLIKNRNFLILSPKKLNDTYPQYFIKKNQKDVKIPLNISFSKASDISLSTNETIFVDADKLKYPLQIRKSKEQDVFQPFGMGGKSKKVSKFFKDEKLSLLEKEKILILCSDNQIVWIVGKRQDERFKVSYATQNILKITLE